MKHGILAALAAFLSGCVVHHDYDYFEPSGLDSVISRPARAPGNVAIKALGTAELTVRSRVDSSGRIVIFLNLQMPPGSEVAFRSDRIEIRNGHSMALRASWKEWTLRDGIGSKRSVPFDAPLKPRSFPDAPLRWGSRTWVDTNRRSGSRCASPESAASP